MEPLQEQHVGAGRITSPYGATSRALELIEGVDLTGKSAIVTGGASGLGIETARALATAGAKVTLAVRGHEAGLRVAKVINDEIGESRVSVEDLDLGNLASVRAFAQGWRERKLSLLINNAGVMACPQSYTVDGFETQIGVNHLGHFLLSLLLLPALKRGAPGRLVSLSSAGHLFDDVHFDDLHYRTRPYLAFEAYGQSKTANALFALEFDRRYQGDGIRAFSVMPGRIKTPLLRHMTPEIYSEIMVASKRRESSAASASSTTPASSIAKTPEQGAATTIWAATGKELNGVGGLYLEDCAEARPFSPDRPNEGIALYARDPDRARRLWELSEREVGLA